MLKMPGSTSNEIDEFVPVSIDADRCHAQPPIIRGRFLPRDELFARVSDFVLTSHKQLDLPSVEDRTLPIAAFILSPSLAVTVNRSAVKPALIQCLLAALCTQISNRNKGTIEAPLTPTLVDAQSDLTLWLPEHSRELYALVQLWNEISRGGTLDHFEIGTTPKLYGSKERLTDFLFGIAVACLPKGAPILDLMAGTGIVARKYAARHPVMANDANPYAALLTRAQGISLEPGQVTDVMRRLRPAFDANLDGIHELIATSLEEEATYLHADYTMATLKACETFCSNPILPSYQFPAPGLPHALCTSRYSNAYFGVFQAAEIDSLRASIDISISAGDSRRDLCLVALIIAVCICNSGPHFAQPPKVTSVKALRDIIERRARSVLWEFEVALRRLASRRALALPLGPVTMLDWRDALDAFTARLGAARPAGVYLDPPYSKLQYSRYYHVLNVLLAYDYPITGGMGRYPPRAERFSSRFEYQPKAAEREFQEVFERCASAGLHLMLSYGESGFLPITSLIKNMTAYFRHVQVFSESIRHHSQGTPLLKSKGRIVEYVLVGTP
jgi:adenine-specific DNA-methyltransferase